MLRIKQFTNAEHAAGYYTQQLATGDYFLEGHDVRAQWKGKAADRLGLDGEVTREGFLALALNTHPSTHEPLTARTKAGRTVAYDFSFHPPKSLSVLYALSGDQRLLDAFNASVKATMAEIESEFKTRVRKGGVDEERTTGNAVWAQFTHLTSRPIDGVPDPHLHAHCFVFNATHDLVEDQWKAAQFRDLKRDAPYFEAAFHARLARSLNAIGYPTQRTHERWEVKDIPRSVLDKFSRRTSIIEQAAKDKGITDPRAKDELGAKTREAKRSALEMSAKELRQHWTERLSPEEQDAVHGVLQSAQQPVEAVDLERRARATERAIDHALSHCLERRSTISTKRLLAEALRYGVGQISVNELKHRIEQREDVLQGEVDGEQLATTREVLAEELVMLETAANGRGTCRPLGAGVLGNPGDRFEASPKLSEEQRAAVEHVLGSTDRVIAIRGGAGTGKTTLMKEVARGIEAGAHEMTVVAPTADASRIVLRGEGFTEADTVAKLLNDPDRRAALRGQVLWVDEAGLLSTRQMSRLVALADRADARLLLTGDTRQHRGVERSPSALRLLEERAGIVPAEVKTIRRQQGAYKHAVEALQDRDIATGLERLDAMGAIVEVADGLDRAEQVARDVVRTLERGQTIQVICPTHAEGRTVTTAIREELQAAGLLGSEENTVTRYRDLQLTKAEKADPQTYQPGMVVSLHQNVPGFVRSSNLTVVDRDCEPNRVPVVDAKGNPGSLWLKHADRWTVGRVESMRIAPGERLRITKGGRGADGFRLENGSQYDVNSVNDNGDLVLTNGHTIGKDFGHLSYAYVTTSYASQGKTVDRVIITQGAESAPAASTAQFYVSASRGRKSIAVYTDNREDLLHAVSKHDQHRAAIELMAQQPARDKLRQHWLRLERLGQVASKLAARGVGPTPPSRSVMRRRQHTPRGRSSGLEPGA